MIYLDNSATSFPKPEQVYKTYKKAIKYYFSNPGRGGYDNSVITAEKIYEVRLLIAGLFGCEDERNVVFTPNCTTSVNTVIKGILRDDDHVIISDLEHNCVSRPIYKLFTEGRIKYDKFETDFYNDENTLENLKRLIKPETKMVICTHASNVLGYCLPIKEIGKVCKENNIVFVVDAAQSAGIIDIDIKRDNIDFLCCAPHKGLFAPMGTGILICSNKPPKSLIEGGTGSASASLIQPESLPDKLEAGTLNVPGIIALGSGIDFINRVGVQNIHLKECSQIIKIFESLKNQIITYCDYTKIRLFSPVISFNIPNKDCEEVADFLNEKGICVRAGLHCSALAHKKIGTLDRGTVRISPSYFTNDNEINYVISTIKNII